MCVGVSSRGGESRRKATRSLLIVLLVVGFTLGGAACSTSSPTPGGTLPSSVSTVAGTSSTLAPPDTTEPVAEPSTTGPSTSTLDAAETSAVGCAGADYPDWETSAYVLPFPVGKTYPVDLSNCSSSYHSTGSPDQFAVDFAMDEGTLITAARDGVVVFVEERGKGGEINNLVVVSHGDGTYAEYMHLVLGGALVSAGDKVEQGDEIGLSGATGLAGYPHLHFVVAKDSWQWPYEGVPVTFSNTAPNPHGLASYTEYTALDYP